MVIRLEHRGAFVELARHGVTLHRAWGAIGGGRTGGRVDPHPDAESAEAALLDQLRRLERKGFRVGHHHAAMEEAIVAAPDEAARRLVYADWLVERGDPRGELITRMASGVAIDDWLARHPHALAPAWTAGITVEWWLGFASTVAMANEGGLVHDLSLLSRLFRHPSFMVVTELRLSAKVLYTQILRLALRHRPRSLSRIDVRGVDLRGPSAADIPGLVV